MANHIMWEFIIIIGGAVITGFMAFFMFLWKRSVYGELNALRVLIEKAEAKMEKEIGIARELAAANISDLKATAAREVAESKLTATRGIGEIKAVIEQVRGAFVPLNLCVEKRTGCQDLLIEKIISFEKLLGGKLDALCEQMAHVIERMDAHINGEKRS